MKYILLAIFTCIGSLLHAQGIDEATTASNENPINIHADPRLDVVVKKAENSEPVIRRSYKTKGFRIQIYNGSDRAKATQAKVKFMKLFPGLRSYLVYNAPNFRVRVGDFRNRKEAQDLYNRLAPHFNPRMIVPEVITVSPKKVTNDK